MMELQIQDEAVKKLLSQVDKALSTGRAVFKEFSVYFRQVTDNTFKKLRHGGSYRGVSWDYFAPQYTRKTDSVVVPAWGGVPKIKAGYAKKTKTIKLKTKSIKIIQFGKTGGKNVRGKLRPSGTRVKQGDSVVQDSGTLRARAALVVALKSEKLVVGPQGVSYAADQQEMRPFLFFEQPKDSEALLKIALRHLQKGIT